MLINRKSFLLASAATVMLPAQTALARTKPIYMLPTSSTRRFAWTIDDGASSSAIKNYLDLAQKHDQHLTFFVTSCYSSWSNNATQIKELLGQGKIQIANHTFSHKDLVSSSDKVVKDELNRCNDFIFKHFDYQAKPYFRPTYGYWNQHLIELAASLGYTVPVMWYGSFGDSGNTPEGRIVQLASKWIANGRIVIDHANRMKSQHALNQILGIIQARGLKSVTLDEAFGVNFK